MSPKNKSSIFLQGIRPHKKNSCNVTLWQAQHQRLVLGQDRRVLKKVLDKPVYESSILAIIPARGGSKGIINKNIRKLSGRPLLYYSLLAAKNCRLINKTLVSTDSPKIARIAERYQAWVPFLRPKNLSTDSTAAAQVISHTLNWLVKHNHPLPKIFIYLQPTSPFRTTRQLQEAIKQFNQAKTADTLVSVCRVPHNFLPEKIMKLEKGFLINHLSTSAKNPKNRQQSPRLYARNGPAIIIRQTTSFLKTQKIYGDKIVPFIMSGSRANLDINELEDLQLAKFYLKN